ncbi:hypothetical protein HJG60_010409 [Phyllostomus discolor]|uniref:Uncharacterized protein n=1 Tax=Phyllostomus discolor TaxID=89673 RepID=A0A834AYN9_9CHIR|nr:hypothetical protein HJG60_010409 [Phyllostomus discolor]
MRGDKMLPVSSLRPDQSHPRVLEQRVYSAHLPACASRGRGVGRGRSGLRPRCLQVHVPLPSLGSRIRFLPFPGFAGRRPLPAPQSQSQKPAESCSRGGFPGGRLPLPLPPAARRPCPSPLTQKLLRALGSADPAPKP